MRFTFSNRFYQKQQLRCFHGKIKEGSFRNFIRYHLRLRGNFTYSFFDRLESRLDIIFFRRRFLPTIYSSHQFIHHYGLDINGKLNYGPRVQVQIGDRISPPFNI